MNRKIALAILLVSTCAVDCFSQNNITPTSIAPTSTENGRVVRDPTTGKAYYQQWMTESVPTVRWENKLVTTTVYETQWVNTVVPSTQTIYQPQTKQVPQAYWKGAWNPFQQPTLAYKFNPVTTWVPQTATINQVVPRQQVVAKQQTITVPQPITETKTQHRLVQTEVPQNSTAAVASSVRLPTGYTANQPPALLSIPLLARRPFTPSAGSQLPTVAAYGAPSNGFSTAGSSSQSNFAAGQNGSGFRRNYWSASPNTASTGWSAPAPASQFVVSPSTGLRPVTNLVQSVLPPASYNAPMRTATAHGGNWNVSQQGMQPTVLR